MEISKEELRSIIDILTERYNKLKDNELTSFYSDCFKPKFVIPDNWCLKITEKNIQYCKNISNSELGMEGKNYPYRLGGYYGPKVDNSGFLGNSVNDGRTEISFEEFKKYILKINEI